MSMTTRVLSVLAILTGLVGMARLEWVVAAVWLGGDRLLSAKEWWQLEEKAAALDLRSQEVRQRSKVKEEIVWRLIKGRVTLLKAAVLFRALNATDLETGDLYRRAFPGNSDGEKLCRQVIAWAASESASRLPANQVSALAKRWEEELEELLRWGGGVVLLPEE